MTTTTFENIEKAVAVLEEYDLQILTDIAGDPETVHDIEWVFLLGWQGDRSAGIRGGVLDCAPAFPSSSAALDWIAEHEADIRSELDG